MLFFNNYSLHEKLVEGKINNEIFQDFTNVCGIIIMKMPRDFQNFMKAETNVKKSTCLVL